MPGPIVMLMDPLSNLIEDLKSYAKRGIDLMGIWYEGMTKNDPTQPFNIMVGENIKIPKLYGYTSVHWTTDRYNHIGVNADIPEGQLFVAAIQQKRLHLYELPELEIFKPKIDKFLYLIDTEVLDQAEVFIAFMGIKIVKKFGAANAADVLTHIYKIFQSQPTPSNVLRMFQTMEAIILKKAKDGQLDDLTTGEGEKWLTRFDKLKALALSTPHHEERHSAADKCYKAFLHILEETK